MNTPSHARRRIRPGLLALLVVLAVGGVLSWWLLGAPGPTAFSKGPQVALEDYHAADPTGVPASLAHADVVRRGEYLAKAADCVVCHTAKNGAPYTGGFAFTLPFGTIYSTNITPDEGTGIGSYTDAQFLDALRRGVRRDGARLYPAMPYTSYAYITDADGLAIKAYLSSLPPVAAPSRRNTLTFPFNQRPLMALWSVFFNRDQRFRPDASQSPEWNRGAYLAEALAHCGECHTPRNLAFALDGRRKFGGALTAGWHAYNISSDPSAGIGTWSDEEVRMYLSTGHAPGHGTASGPMGEAVDESLSELAPEDIQAIVVYVRSVPAVRSRDVPAQLAGPATFSHRDGPGSANAMGKQMFEGACVSCHGWSGQSPLDGYADLTGSRAVNDPHAINVVQMVIAGLGRNPAHGGLRMPGFERYSDTEIAAVANYVTARFGSTASQLKAPDVASLRKQSAQQ